MSFQIPPSQLFAQIEPFAWVAGAIIVGGFVLVWLSAGVLADVIVAALAKLWAMIYRLFNDLPE